MKNWKSVVGFEAHYQVSDCGQVKSMKYHGGFRITPRIMKQKPTGAGYLRVSLCIDSKITMKMVAHMVIEAFIGERPDGMVVCHNDGDNQNNHLTNLRYDTPTNNVKDKLKHGTSFHGGRNPSAKLTNDQVVAIKLLLKAGRRQVDIADDYGVSKVTINHISTGRTWGGVS